MERMKETIRICKDRDVLKEDLERKEQEALSMLMEPYDQEDYFGQILGNFFIIFFRPFLINGKRRGLFGRPGVRPNG